MQRLRYLSFVLAGLVAVEGLSAAGIRSETVKTVTKAFHSAVDSPTIAGASHLVVRQGEEVYFAVGGKSDVEGKRAFERDTIVRIYSMTKPITSVAAMILFEREKFKLDDPVGRFIPAFLETTVLVEEEGTTRIVPANRPMTVRDVFRHTTGYSYGEGQPNPLSYYEVERMRYRPPNAMMPPRMTIAQAAEALARIPALHHPGERFTYGFSTDLLGRLIEVWSGQSLDQFLQDALFDPLQMKDTGFSVPMAKRHRLASCHFLKDGKLVVVDKASTSEFNEGFEFLSGGGGLLSTIDDYGHFCQLLVESGRFQGRQLIEKDTLDLMFTDQLDHLPGDFQFGLGFAIRQIDLVVGGEARKATQFSWGGYASTDFRVIPKEGLYQIMFRQQVPSSHGLAGRLFQMIYEGLE